MKLASFNSALLLALAASVVMALLGPFGTHSALDLGERLLYWTPLLVGGTVICIGLARIMERYTVEGFSGWPFLLILTVLAALPISGLVSLTSLIAGFGFNWAGFADTYWHSLVITAVMMGLSVLTNRARVGQASALAGETVTPPETDPSREPHTDHLPGPLPDGLRGGTILALAAEDHYLRVHTDRGSDLVLMRLRDAARALDGKDGLQVHRSHWVARSAVTGTARIKGRLHLVLKSGDRIPVSRSYLPIVRAEGWLNQDP